MPSIHDLATLRHVRGFSQRTFAETLKVGRATLARWEKGERGIPLENAVNMANILTQKTPENAVTERDIYDAWQMSKHVASITPKQARKPRTRPPDPRQAA